MHCLTFLAEQHIREYESRRKHVDELVQRNDHLTSFRQSRLPYAAPLELGDRPAEIRYLQAGQWNDDEPDKRELGPMAIWDIVAARVESLVHRLGG